MKIQPNKRKAPRMECPVPVDGQTGSSLNQTKTIDLSKTGMGFISRHPFRINQTIAVELDLVKDEDPVFVFGQVRWVTPIMKSEHFRIGLQFVDYLGKSKNRLARHFAK